MVVQGDTRVVSNSISRGTFCARQLLSMKSNTLYIYYTPGASSLLPSRLRPISVSVPCPPCSVIVRAPRLSPPERWPSPLLVQNPFPATSTGRWVPAILVRSKASRWYRKRRPISDGLFNAFVAGVLACMYCKAVQAVHAREVLE